MSLLRKQESRLLCACCGVPTEQVETLEYALDCRFRGHDTPHPAATSEPPSSPAGGKEKHISPFG